MAQVAKCRRVLQIGSFHYATQYGSKKHSPTSATVPFSSSSCSRAKTSCHPVKKQVWFLLKKIFKNKNYSGDLQVTTVLAFDSKIHKIQINFCQPRFCPVANWARVFRVWSLASPTIPDKGTQMQIGKRMCLENDWELSSRVCECSYLVSVQLSYSCATILSKHLALLKVARADVCLQVDEGGAPSRLIE